MSIVLYLQGFTLLPMAQGVQRIGILLCIVLLPSSQALTDKHWQNLHPLSLFCAVITVNNQKHHNLS